MSRAYVLQSVLCQEQGIRAGTRFIPAGYGGLSSEVHKNPHGLSFRVPLPAVPPVARVAVAVRPLDVHLWPLCRPPAPPGRSDVVAPA